MNTTEHPVSPETIMAFLDGELSAFESASTAAHLSSCTECSAIIANLHDLSGRLSAWPVESAPALLERVLAVANTNQSPDGPPVNLARRFQLFFSRPIPWVFACLVVLALIGQRGSDKEVSSSHLYVPLETQTVPRSGRSVDIAASAKSRSEGGGSGRRGEDALFTQPAPPPQFEQKTTGIGAAPETMIARMVELQITVVKFDGTRSLLDAILARHGGYAAELTASTHEGNARSIRASLRIPAQELAAALTELKSLGRVESETQTGEEVTQQHADLVARLKNSREEEQRLQAILTQRTGKISDVLEVEQEIARVRGEIEQIEAEQKSLEHRVTFATVNLQLNEEYKAALGSAIPPTSTRLHNAAVTGYRDAVESVVSLLLFLAEAGPTLLLWFAVLFFPARWVWRRFRVALARA